MLRFAKLFEAPLVLRVFIASPDFLGTAGLPEASLLHLSDKVTWQGKFARYLSKKAGVSSSKTSPTFFNRTYCVVLLLYAVNRGPDETFLELKNPPKIVEPKRQRTSR